MPSRKMQFLAREHAVSAEDAVFAQGYLHEELQCLHEEAVLHEVT